MRKETFFRSFLPVLSADARLFRFFLELCMERAGILLKGTSLPIEEIALMLGYSNSSNFYKAFREYYHMSPREYERIL